MADEDDLYYLQPGYDLNTLTVPRLRNILVKHDIDFPSSAKKGQLVEVVQQELLPQAKKLLRAQDRVRRTSRGITDVPSSQEGTIDGDDELDRQLMPPPAPKTPRSRKSKSDLAAGAASTVATPSTSRRSKTPSKRTTKTPRASDTEPEPETTVRKSRKSAPAQSQPEPSVTLEEPDIRLKRESLEAGTSPFSDDNPFQSGSSPSSTSKRLSSTSRSRKSLGTSSAVKKSPTKRRTTTSPPVKQEEFSPQRTSIEFPVSRIKAEDYIPVTEEFTPDEAQELAEQERNGQVVPGRRSQLVRRPKKKATSKAAKAAPFTILTALLAAGAAWYRQEKINIGYCGVGESQWSLAEYPQVPPWVHELQPSCEPCPQHAFCSPDMKVECDTDFILKPHPLSLNGLIPFPPTCEPDSEKERKIEAVANKALEELRQRRAAYECGEEVSSAKSLVSDVTEEAKTVATAVSTKLEISEDELKSTIAKQRRKGMTDQDFDALWEGALGNVIARDEVQVTKDGSGKRLLSSSSLARLPFTCAIRKSLLRTISQNRIPLGLLIASVIASIVFYNRVDARNRATAQIPSLVATTLDRLATQAALKEDSRASEPFISVGQLRDDVLRNVFSANERERVWQNVRKVVEGNSNVRASTREGGKTGEWSRVWEWIGPLDLAPGLEGRRSGGFIRGPSSSSPAGSGVDTTVVGSPGDGNDVRESVEIRRWDEGRAIY